MTICKFFQSGNCRFGPKCANEHFDVRQLIKIEVEAAIKGNQWPLSCFGPFKEKQCFPNFIEDQSFEEIRSLCYESKKQNFFHNFQQQFNQQVLDAQDKMKTLLTLNRDIVDVVTAIYDTADPSTTGSGPNQISAPVNSNPFSTIGAGNRDTLQQSTNIFGMGNNQQQQQPASNPFAKSNSGIIGQSVFGNNLFGSSVPASQQQQQQQQTSIFGSNVPQQQQQQQQTTAFGGFGKPPGQTNDTNIFSQQQPQNSIFGGNPIQTTQQFGGGSIFGQQPVVPQQPQQQGNIFNQSSVQPAATGNIFAQASQQLQTPPVQQQQPPNSGFGGFLQPPQFPVQQQQNAGTFGQQPNTQQQLQTNIFGTPQQTEQQFPQQQQQQGFQQNIFSQQPPPQQQQQQQQQLFSNIQPQQQESVNFGQNSNQIKVLFSNTQNMLNQQNSTENVICQQIQTPIYTQLDRLPPEDLHEFQAEQFTLANLPCNPPPFELCQSY